MPVLQTWKSEQEMTRTLQRENLTLQRQNLSQENKRQIQRVTSQYSQLLQSW